MEEVDVSTLMGDFNQALSNLESWKKDRAQRLEQQKRELAAKLSREEKAEDEVASTERSEEEVTSGLRESTRLALHKAKASAASLQAVVSTTSPRFHDQLSVRSSLIPQNADRSESENRRRVGNGKVEKLVEDIKQSSSTAIAAAGGGTKTKKLASDVQRLRAEQFSADLEKDVAERVACYESKYSDAHDSDGAAVGAMASETNIALDDKIGDKLLEFSSDLDTALARMEMWDED